MQHALSLTETPSDVPRYPLVGTQKDIWYYGTLVRGVLNPPETTGMGFWSINPYIGCAFGCAYCYARYAHRFVMERAAAQQEACEAPLGRNGDTSPPDDIEELPPWLAFERRIFVKRNAADALRQALRARVNTAGALRRGEAIVIGTATDPYQPAERTFRVTRSILEALAEARGLRLVLITKSPLVTRDLDVLARITQRSRLTIHISLITLDRELARRIEPRAPTPEARLRALARLREAGIDVGINIMPVLPGITDHPDALTALVRRVAAAGASHVNACALRLRATSRRTYLPWINAEFPELSERYANAYGTAHQIHDRYREGLRQFLKAACQKAGIPYGSPEERTAVATGHASERRRIMAAGRAGGAWDDGIDEPEEPPEAEQLELDMPVGTPLPLADHAYQPQ